MHKLKLFLAVLLTVTTLTHSKPSHAAVGAFTAGSAVAVVGLVVMGAGAVGGVYFTAKILKKCDGLSCFKAIIPILGGAAVIFGGLMILDGEQEIEFKALNQKEASLLNVSEADLALYNSEIDQANMLMANVTSELSKISNPSADDSVAAWNDVRDFVSPATFSVMQKIVSQK